MLVIHDLRTHPHAHVTITELAHYWAVDRRVVYKWIDSGLLPCKRLPGGDFRIETTMARVFELTQMLTTPHDAA